MIEINKMIMGAMLQHSPELPVYKEIKGRFVAYEKSKEALKKPLDESIEIDLIKKIRSEHIETLDSLPEGHPNVENENFFIETLSSFLPKEATIEEMTDFAQKVVEPGNKSNMGNYISQLKAQYPSNNGKDIADIVKKLIG